MNERDFAAWLKRLGTVPIGKEPAPWTAADWKLYRSRMQAYRDHARRIVGG